MAAPNWDWFEIFWPRPLEDDKVVALLEHLSADGSLGRIVFETRAGAGVVRYFVAVDELKTSKLRQVMRASVSGTELIEAEAARPAFTVAVRAQISGSEFSLNTDKTEQTSRAILSALASTRTDETLVLQILLGNRLTPWLTDDVRFDVSGEARSRMRAKRANHGFRALVRLGAGAPAKGRAHGLVAALLGALRTLEGQGTRFEATRTSHASIERIGARFFGFLNRPYSTRELSGMLGLPIGAGELPGVAPEHPALVRPARKLLVAKHPFAVTTVPGIVQPVGVSKRDSLTHTLLIGPTNSGKSTVMAHLILDAIEDGRGVLVIDPKGDLVMQDVLPRIPDWRKKDVVVIDPMSERPVGVTVLQSRGRAPELIADSVLAVLRDLYKDSRGGRASMTSSRPRS